MTSWKPDARYAVVAGLLIAAALVPPTNLEWSRAGLAEFEVWRLLTGHWVHLGLPHLLLNLAGLLLVALLFRQQPPIVSWAVFLPASQVFISAGLWWLTPELEWYRGFSGCLHGLLVFTAIHNLPRERAWCGFILVAVLIKIAWEQIAGVFPGTSALIDGRVITEAHGLGALTGLVGGIILRMTSRLHSDR
ncbi:rhombosortase [Marinobacter sp.]|uniref:rhombosortase n=1 Tax=Marinobacter sp. TaxID=50741 RepID=UPI00384CFFA0